MFIENDSCTLQNMISHKFRISFNDSSFIENIAFGIDLKILIFRE